MPKKLATALFALLSVAMGLLFLYSAFSKVVTVSSYETFRYTIVEYIHIPWIPAAILACFMIGIEFALAALLILNIYGRRKWVAKSALALIIVFSVYLVYLWALMGDDVNCGCFGDAIWMSPSTSLIKNAITAAVLLLLIKFHNGLRFRRDWIVILILGIAGVVSPFIMYPIPDSSPEWIKGKGFKLDLSSLYAPGKTDAPTTDLTKGKHVIAFVSLSCPHCQMAAYKMHVMKVKNPSLPFQLVYAGKDKYKAEFFKKSKATNMPATRLDADTFTGLVGWSWPVIYLVKDGWVVAKTTYVQMDQGEIEKWLKQPW
jgi:hypothetical protein